MKLLIHSYMTSGFFSWAILYLKTLKKFNGEKHTVFFDCRDFTKKQKKELKKLYSNLIIKNETIDYEELKNRSGISIQKLKKLKVDVETKRKNINTLDKILWKQFISVEERYRGSIPYAFDTYKDNFTHILHLDIDTCFIGSIDPIINLMENRDVVFRFQDTKPPKNKVKKNQNKVIWGHTLGIKLTKQSRDFIQSWCDIIDSKDLKNKPKGFGQTSLYKAFELHRDELNWDYMPYYYTLTDNVYRSNPKLRNKVILLTGNKGKKSKVFNFFSEEVKKRGKI